MNAVIINSSDHTLTLEVRLEDGSSYSTSIPVGGAWTPPADVQSVNFES